MKKTGGIQVLGSLIQPISLIKNYLKKVNNWYVQKVLRAISLSTKNKDFNRKILE